MKTSPLICSTNQWTGFYMITASVMKELNSRLEKNIYFAGISFCDLMIAILVTTSLVTSLIELQIVDQCDCYQTCKRNYHFVTISSDMRYTGTNITL